MHIFHCLFNDKGVFFPLLLLHSCAKISAKSSVLSVLCSAINQEATGLQWAVIDLRILQVAGREGGSSPSE